MMLRGLRRFAARTAHRSVVAATSSVSALRAGLATFGRSELSVFFTILRRFFGAGLRFGVFHYFFASDFQLFFFTIFEIFAE